jgi:hypothetical protein
MFFKEKVYPLQAFFELYKYQQIYKKVLTVARKRENEIYLKINKPLKSFVANNKKGIRNWPKNQLQHH